MDIGNDANQFCSSSSGWEHSLEHRSGERNRGAAIEEKEKTRHRDVGMTFVGSWRWPILLDSRLLSPKGLAYRWVVQ